MAKIVAGIVTIFGVLVSAIAFIFLLSLIPVFLWYCFDDFLAGITGISQLGEVAWYHVYSIVLFIGMVFKSKATATAKND